MIKKGWNQDRHKSKEHTSLMQALQSTKPVKLTIHIDEPIPPNSNMNPPEQVSANHRINGLMGHDPLLLAINVKDLENDWKLFKYIISAPKPPNQNYADEFKLPTTNLSQPDSTMAPKMRGSVSNSAKAKAWAIIEARKKVIEDEKKMSSLQQRLNRIRKSKLDEHK